MKQSDKHWEKFGEADPYYWVTTQKKYRNKLIDNEKLKFFSLKEKNIEINFLM